MEMNRRNFLCGALLTALGTTAGFVENAEAATGVKKLSDGTVEVTPASVKAFAKVGGVVLLGDVNGTPAALVKTGANQYDALSLRCTHAGVTVKPTSGGFYCDPQRGGHGSGFTKTGAVNHGPATSPLKKLSVTPQSAGKKLIIS